MDVQPDFQLDGQVAIVTGGSSGIGRAVCLELATHGARVVVVGTRERNVLEVVDEVRTRVGNAAVGLGLALDVCNERDMDEMVSRTVQEFGRIDILIASAGTLRGQDSWPRQLAAMTTGEWDEVIATNLSGVFLSNRAVLREMIRRRSGEIVNLSSTSGLRGLAYDSAYCASKFGVIGLTESVAEEVRQHGIRVQVLLPGAVDTPMWKTQDAIPHLEPALPVSRMAEVILYMITLPKDSVLSRLVVTAFSSKKYPTHH